MKYLYLICLLLIANIASARPMGEGQYTSSLGATAAWTVMAFNAAYVNQSNTVDISTERVNIGVRQGRWLTFAYFMGSEFNYNRFQYNYLRHNGTTIRGNNYGFSRRYTGGSDRGKENMSITQFTSTNATDYVECVYYKHAGTAMTTQSGMADSATMRAVGIWLGD